MTFLELTKKMAGKIIALLAVISTLMSSQALPPAYSDIDTVSWEDLSDTDISPQGRVALTFDKDLWKHAQTGHFIYHFTDAKASETVYFHAEVYYKWIKDFFGVTEDSWKKKSHIFIFTEEKTWNDFKAGVKHEGEAAAFTNFWELFMLREPLWTSPRRSLAHEITHVVLFRFADGPVPLFLNEGFACFAASQLLKMQLEVNNYQPAPLKPLSAGEYIPLATIAAMTRYPEEDVNVFYAEAEWFARFIVFTYGKEKFYDLLRAVSKGGDFITSAEKVCGIDLDGLEDKFKAYALQ